MKSLTLNLEDEIFIYSKYRITPNELVLIKTLFLLQEEGDEEIFKNYITSLHQCNIKPRSVILSLQEKGIILKSFKIGEEGSSFDPHIIPLNKNFIKTLYKSSLELGKELFNSYPQWTSIKGNLVSLRGVSKHFDSLEDCYFKYGKAINWNIDRHNRIIELVNWASENSLLAKSLGAFVVDNGWLDLESLQETDTSTKIL